MSPLLEITNLKTYFDTPQGESRAVDGVSLRLNRGETLGVVGESGCGKTVTALSILRLVPSPPGRYVGGEILFEGQDMLRLPEAQMRQIRGNHISMIFQEPMTALNPVFTIEDQIGETLRLHRHLSRSAARQEVLRLLHLVRVAEPERRLREHPHELSGGMRQRVVIAMALACQPHLLIADEPTTALDVTVQAQILSLMDQLKQELGSAVMLITHDLGVVAEVADQVAVMYAGLVVEYTSTVELFQRPWHPYTLGLFRSIPGVDVAPGTRLSAIPGVVPNPTEWPSGCRFHPRCPFRMPICDQQPPELLPIAGDTEHLVRCWMYHPW